MIMVLMAFSLLCGTLMGFRGPFRMLTISMFAFGMLPFRMLPFRMLTIGVLSFRAFERLQGVVEPASFGVLSGLAYHGL